MPVTPLSKEDLYAFIFADIKKRLDDPGVIYTLHDKIQDFDPISSGVTVIDELLCGGLPEGRIIELFGPEASGKTTVALHFIAEAQRQGYVVYFVDAEHALDMAYAERIGVDTSKLLFSQPDYGEQALETVRAICDSTTAAKDKFGQNIRSLVIIDSVPALVPKGEFEKYAKEGLDSTVAMGGPSRMMAGKLPLLVGAASRSGVTICFINQERDKIGVTFGPTTTTPGGRALKFFSSLRLKVYRVGNYKQGDTILGIRTQMIPVKSKLFPIFQRKAEFIIGNDGINVEASMVETLIAKGVLKKNGTWFKFQEWSIQGAVKVEEQLREDKEFRVAIDAALAGAGGQTVQVELQPKKVVAGITAGNSSIHLPSTPATTGKPLSGLSGTVRKVGGGK